MKRISSLLLSLVLLLSSAFGAAEFNRFVGITPSGGQAIHWANDSIMVLLGGNQLLPVPSGIPVGGVTKIRIGFTGGTQADIGNIVLYKTDQYTHVVESSVQLTYLTQSAFSLTIPAGTSVSAPAVFELDQISATNYTPDTTHDYFVVVYFTNTANNGNLVVATAAGVGITSMLGSWLGGDQTGIAVGAVVPFTVSAGGINSWLVLQVVHN